MPEPPTSSAKDRTLACPRCAYDLSGPLPTWTDACPVTGTCPECGLAFAWRDVFDPLRDVPPWFFELVPNRPVRNTVSTALHTLVPWRFWRAIRLSLPVDRVRLLILLVSTLIVWQVATPLVDAVASFIWLTGRVPSGVGPWIILDHMAEDWRKYMAWPIGRPDAIDRVLGAWLLTSAIIPFCFLPIGETLARAHTRPAHLVRATTYSIIALIATWLTWNAIQLIAEFEIRFDPFQWHRRHWENRPLDRWITIIRGDTLDGEVSWPIYYPLWMLITWWCVCRFYLRIRHAFLTALLLMVMALLLTPLIGYPLGFFDALIDWLV